MIKMNLRCITYNHVESIKPVYIFFLPKTNNTDTNGVNNLKLQFDDETDMDDDFPLNAVDKRFRIKYLRELSRMQAPTTH